MILEYRRNVFIAKTNYSERELPKKANFRWDPVERVWWTKFPTAAMKLYHYANDVAKQELDKLLKNAKESEATTTSLVVPEPPGLKLYPFQKAGIEFMLKRDAVLMGCDMGTGKSCQVVGVVNLDTSLRKVLIICPASLKLMWRNELDKWLMREMSVGIADSRQFPKTDIVIINYDILTKWRGDLRSLTWDLRVCDEAHYLRNPRTLRVHNVLGKWNKKTGGWEVAPIPARKRFMLTGTPIVNRPVELWPIIRALDPGTWTSYKYFTKRYCAGHQGQWGYDASGGSNLEELGNILRSTIMIRRRKEDVLTELPPKTRQVIEFDAPDSLKPVLAEESRIWEERLGGIQQLQDDLVSADEARYRDAVRKLKEARRIAFSEMSRVRHQTAVAKIPTVIQFIKGVLEGEQKVVVFVHHHDVARALEAAFPGAAVLTGEVVSKQKRQDAIDKFQNDPRCLLFIGSITAAGVGITLTAASICIFAELDWVPGNVSQCEDRLVRIGQKCAVTIQHLVYSESIDAKMAKMIVKKQEVIDRVVNRGMTATIAPPPPKPVTPPPVAPKVTMSEQQKRVIHQALRYLSRLCDGARSLDGMGFNKFDSAFGKSLAGKETLTDYQAAAGQRMLRKYYGQLRETTVKEIEGT